MVGSSNPHALAVNGPPPNTGAEYPASVVGSYRGLCNNPSDLIQLYNAVLPCAYWDWMHRGFVYAGTSGDYTFTLPPGVDDSVYVWAGDADIVRSNYYLYNAVLINQGTFVYTATAGEYIPLRVQFNQVTGPWQFGLTITAPDGSIILDGHGQASTLVQYACDGSTSAWLPWGSEGSG